jgi:hypothetical protein
MGRSRGGLIAINLEPHIHFSKSKFTGKTAPENFPPNAGQLVLTSSGPTDPNSAKNRASTAKADFQFSSPPRGDLNF